MAGRSDPGPSAPVFRGVLPGEGPGRRVALADVIAGVGGQAAVMVDAARWPAHLHILDLRRPGQSEMQPGVARRLIAAAAETVGDQESAAGLHAHAGADRVAV